MLPDSCRERFLTVQQTDRQPQVRTNRDWRVSLQPRRRARQRVRDSQRRMRGYRIILLHEDGQDESQIKEDVPNWEQITLR